MAFAVTHRLVTLFVVFDDGVADRREPYGVVEVEYVGESHVAFRGGIQLDHTINAEAVLEVFPDARAQAVTDDGVDLVVLIVRLFRLLVQVTAQLAHIAEGGTVMAADVVPEATGGEFARNDNGAGTGDHGRPADHHAGGVVERQGGVNAVILGQAYGGEAEATIGFFPAAVVEDHRFGQTSGAGGVNVEQRVAQESLLAGRRVLTGAVTAFAGQVLVTRGGFTGVLQGVLIRKEEEIVFQIQITADFFHSINQFFANDGGFGFHQIETMDQYLAALGGIDQGCADAQLGAGKNSGQQLGAVFHVDGNGIAFFQADRGQVVCQAVGPGVELLVGKFCVLVDHGSAIRVHAGGALDSNAQPQWLAGVSDFRHLRALDQAGKIGDYLWNLGQKLGQRDDVGVAHRISIVCVLGRPGKAGSPVLASGRLP